MALATLCREVTDPYTMASRGLNEFPTTTSFTAFIVDHKLRENSGVEAQRVAIELERLGIEPHVLELEWQHDPSKLSNVESAARALRYQALGRACRDREIDSLLLAHHADDQAETVMTRLLSNYVGAGLRGMSFIAPIPECTGIHGVDQSGAHETADDHVRRKIRRARGSILTEMGGVEIARPLLTFPKAQLVAVCRQNSVRWFEDHTNADPTLTLRNTVRYLNKTNVFPPALRKPQLQALASKISQEYREVEQAAHCLFTKMPLTLNLRSGEATFTFLEEFTSPSPSTIRLYSELLRKMLAVVAPKDTISLQDLNEAVNFVFHGRQANEEDMRSQTPEKIQIAGVSICREDHLNSTNSQLRMFRFHRQIPTKQERASIRTTLSFPSHSGDLEVPRWSEWHLWDGRYWLRVRPPINHTGDVEITVRFLDKSDLEHLRKSLDQARVKQVNELLQVAKGHLRFTLPVIVTRKLGDIAEGDPQETIVALPSLQWNVGGWKRDKGETDANCWLWDVRYKHVNLSLNRPHKVTS